MQRDVDGLECCHRIKAGRFWTVIYFEPGRNEGIEIGTSWADEETAQELCDLMNMAYEAGTEDLRWFAKDPRDESGAQAFDFWEKRARELEAANAQEEGKVRKLEAALRKILFECDTIEAAAREARLALRAPNRKGEP